MGRLVQGEAEIGYFLDNIRDKCYIKYILKASCLNTISLFHLLILQTSPKRLFTQIQYVRTNKCYQTNL